MSRASEHTCHAVNCTAHVPPRMHMCKRHWSMVPRPLQRALWAAYKPGQERNMTHWHEWRELPDARRSESVAESNISTTFMRLDHARLVGRPCARCWGEHEVLTDGPDRT